MTTAAFWLRTQLHREDEAVRFLREGWRANPDSYAILLELGRLFYQNRKMLFAPATIGGLAQMAGASQQAGTGSVFLRANCRPRADLKSGKVTWRNVFIT